jgi:hypothetical protein
MKVIDSLLNIIEIYINEIKKNKILLNNIGNNGLNAEKKTNLKIILMKTID